MLVESGIPWREFQTELKVVDMCLHKGEHVLSFSNKILSSEMLLENGLVD